MPRLTKRVVDASRPRQRDYFVWDDDVKGFAVRVWPATDKHPDGRKQFVFEYRDPTRRNHRLRIGDYGPYTVDEARKKAETFRGWVNEGRTDPARYPHARVAAQKAEKTAPTVAELAALFLTNRRKRAKPRTVEEYGRLLDRDILPAIGNARVNDVTRRDVERLLATMEDRPAVANNVHIVLRAMFTYACDHELRADGKNPCARIQHFRLKSRKKSLAQPDYKALGAALLRAETKGLPVPPSLKDAKRGESRKRKEKRTGKKRGPYKVDPSLVRDRPNPIAVAVIRFLALSGWREGEALALRRDAIDWDRGVAILQDSKSGRSVRPLGAAALEVLRTVPPFAGNPYVFPGAKPGDHLKEVKRLWLAAKHAAELRVRLHDLRHSFTTVGRELGYSDYVIARLVGHVIDSMTSRYGDVPDVIVKQAADNIAATISNRLAGKAAKVLAFLDRTASA